jgi:putative colanic acid biosynthesis acetyltransferase WcaF
MEVDLTKYDNSWYEPGRGRMICGIWYLVNVIFFQNPLNPSSALKAALLKAFGAKVGKGVVLKPSINIKYPWHLEIGDNSWIGEGVWIDCLAPIRIGSHCCISQGVYFCTGNHDWKDTVFGLKTDTIVIEAGCWVGAKSNLLPGAIMRSHSVLTAGGVLSGEAEAWGIYVGNPAVKKRTRSLR